MSFFETKLSDIIALGIGAISFIAWLVRLEGKTKNNTSTYGRLEGRIEKIEQALPTFTQQMNNLIADIREIKTNVQWLIQISKKTEE